MGLAGKFGPYQHGIANADSKDLGWIWPGQNRSVERSAAGCLGEIASARGGYSLHYFVFFKGSMIMKIASIYG